MAKFDYFQVFVQMSHCTARSAQSLYDTLATFQPEQLKSKLEELHAMEREGDALNHTLTKQLVREFLPPIDREDILILGRQLDEVTDCVDDILRRIYMLRVEHMTPDAIAFCELLLRMCNAMSALMAEFPQFKKADTRLDALIAELNELEEEGDALHLRAIRDLWGSESSTRACMTWREIYEAFELCCDEFEHVANTVEEIVMKNS